MTGQQTWAAASDQERLQIIELLRRILQLSDDATVEDINAALLEIDARGTALTAAEDQVRERLGISQERWLKYA